MKRLAGLVLFTLATLIVAHTQSSTTPTSRLLVLNKEDATLAIIDPESGAGGGTVPVGQGPHELLRASKSAVNLHRAISRTSSSSIRRRSAIGQPTSSRTSTRPASGTCGSTACRC